VSFQYIGIRIFAAVSLAAILSVAGCSSGGDGPGPYNVAQNLNMAWNHFASEDYDQALTKFNEVLLHSENNPEALLGKGWSFAFEADYDSSITFFESAIDNGLGTADALMGLAVVYRDYPNYSLGMSKGAKVIEADSFYVFAERSTIDYKDAHLIRAECAYLLGSSYFPTAHDEINYLCDLLGEPEPLPDPGTLPGGEYEILMAERLEDLSLLISD
jgi:tetratricopeptide (TPR) repeat protein